MKVQIRENWGIEITSETKEEQYLLAKIDAYGLKVSGISMGKSVLLSLSNFADLRQIFLEPEQASSLAFAIGHTISSLPNFTHYMQEITPALTKILLEITAKIHAPPPPPPAPSSKTLIAEAQGRTFPPAPKSEKSG